MEAGAESTAQVFFAAKSQSAEIPAIACQTSDAAFTSGHMGYADIDDPENGDGRLGCCEAAGAKQGCC